jgi:O-antigen/teichoic acid export membrane protein
VGFGVRAQIGTASPLETFQIDQLLVGVIAGPVALGFYVIGSAFMNLPRFIAQSLGMVAFPRVAAARMAGGAQEVAKQALYATVLLSGGTVVILELAMGALVPLFFGGAYDAAIPVARILLIAAFCFSLRRVLGDTLRGANRPLPGTFAEIATWLVYLVAVVPLTLTWEAKGAATAVAIAAAVGLAYIAAASRINSNGAMVDSESNPEPNPATVG